MICFPAYAQLPNGFVYLSDIDPTIIQEIRYAGSHNFIGRPITGYKKPICILTKKAALKLKKVQSSLYKRGYSLKVYDCYRPKSATNEMYKWSQDSDSQEMKTEFFPRVKKSELFEKGYIALYSGHNRGSTVDLTIVDMSNLKQEKYNTANASTSCFSKNRFKDNSIDMGTGFDCLDSTANINNDEVSAQARKNRLMLQAAMKRYGFVPYSNEWWHFTLRHEPFRKYYDFPVI